MICATTIFISKNQTGNFTELMAKKLPRGQPTTAVLPKLVNLNLVYSDDFVDTFFVSKISFKLRKVQTSGLFPSSLTYKIALNLHHDLTD